MDNTGNYIDYDELLVEFFFSSSKLVTSQDTVLSSLVVDAGGDFFDFTGTAPAVGDVVEQLGKSAIIIDVTGSTIQINKTGAENTITENPARFLHSDLIPQFRGEDLILDAMSYIEAYTQNFFNSRDLVFKIEGNNTHTLWLPVPIIAISKFTLNGDDEELTEGEDEDFFAFKGRVSPTDDRQNPRIKLSIRANRGSIFSNTITTVYRKGTLTSIEGSFGYLEEDGTTPRLIKRATTMLVALGVNQPAGNTGSGNAGTGPRQRLKVDLHEEWFFDNKASTSRGSISGNAQIDQILARYRIPIQITGSIEMFPLELRRRHHD